MANWEETIKLAEEINWVPEEIYVYKVAQATPDLERIIKELNQSGEIELAHRLDQFIIDAVYDGWADAQIELVINPEYTNVQKSAQPSHQSKAIILNEVLPHVRNQELKNILQELIDSLPPIGHSHNIKPPAPSI